MMNLVGFGDVEVSRTVDAESINTQFRITVGEQDGPPAHRALWLTLEEAHDVKQCLLHMIGGTSLER